jgi:hypothetical protein
MVSPVLNIPLISDRVHAVFESFNSESLAVGSELRNLAVLLFWLSHEGIRGVTDHGCRKLFSIALKSLEDFRAFFVPWRSLQRFLLHTFA